MKKAFIIPFLIFGLLSTTIQASAETKKACSKSQVNKIKSSLICKKIGNVYRWTPVTIPTPTPTSSPTPIPSPTPAIQEEFYFAPSIPGDNVELCKIKESSNRRQFTVAGFPSITPLTPRTGTVKWALIPVDFQDMQGEKDFRDRVSNDMKLLSEWFDTVSEGKLKVEWVLADNWVRLPGNSSDYIINKGVNNTPNGIKFFKTAMKSADPTFDFTNIQTVNFILPINQNIAEEGENGFPWDQHVLDTVTNEGKISSFSIAGKYQTKDKKTLWNYWAHEFGHAIGLPHVGGNTGYSPIGNWDVLADQDGTSRELSGWIRFLAGWMSDDRIFCKDSNSVNKIEMNLVPLSNKEPGVKLAIFPLSVNRALIIESRRVTKFSCTTPTPRDGILVYHLNLTLGHAQDFMIPISPEGRNSKEVATCNGMPYGTHLNQLLKEGDVVNFENLKVEFVKQGKFDKIVVSK